MAKYLLLKHYRGAPASINDVPMDQWTPEEISAHVQYMNDFAARLEGTGEFVDSQALSAEGTFVRYDGEGRPPVTDGPFAETKDLIAGWMVIDVETRERALELAGELSAAPGAGGKQIHEWLEVRPFLTAAPTTTECGFHQGDDTSPETLIAVPGTLEQADCQVRGQEWAGVGDTADAQDEPEACTPSLGWCLRFSVSTAARRSSVSSAPGGRVASASPLVRARRRPPGRLHARARCPGARPARAVLVVGEQSDLDPLSLQ